MQLLSLQSTLYSAHSDAQTDSLEQTLAATEHSLTQKQEANSQLRASLSWRITAPFRTALDILLLPGVILRAWRKLIDFKLQVVAEQYVEWAQQAASNEDSYIDFLARILKAEHGARQARSQQIQA